MKNPEMYQGGLYSPIINEAKYNKLRKSSTSLMRILNVQVFGHENLDNLATSDNGDGVIIAANKKSWLNLLTILGANDLKPVRFLISKEKLKLSLLLNMAEDCGMVFYDKNVSDSPATLIKKSVNMLRHGEWLAMFYKDKLNTENDGNYNNLIATAALKATGVTPILPVSIGTKSKTINQMSHLNSTVVFGEPIFVEKSEVNELSINEFNKNLVKNLDILEKQAVNISEYTDH